MAVLENLQRKLFIWRFLLAVLILNLTQAESKLAVAEKANHSAIQTNSPASNLPQIETSESQIKAELGFFISSAYQSQKSFLNKLNSSKGTKRRTWNIGWLLSAQTCRFSPLAWTSIAWCAEAHPQGSQVGKWESACGPSLLHFRVCRWGRGGSCN